MVSVCKFTKYFRPSDFTLRARYGNGSRSHSDLPNMVQGRSLFLQPAKPHLCTSGSFRGSSRDIDPCQRAWGGSFPDLGTKSKFDLEKPPSSASDIVLQSGMVSGLLKSTNGRGSYRYLMASPDRADANQNTLQTSDTAFGHKVVLLTKFRPSLSFIKTSLREVPIQETRRHSHLPIVTICSPQQFRKNQDSSLKEPSFVIQGDFRIWRTVVP